MYRNGMCSASWLPISQHGDCLCNSSLHSIEYLPSYCVDNTVSSNNQLTNIYPSELLSLYSYDYRQCPSLAAAAPNATHAKEWLKFTCFPSNLEAVSRKFKVSKGNIKSFSSFDDLSIPKLKTRNSPIVEVSKKMTKQKRTNNDNSASIFKTIKLDCEANLPKNLDETELHNFPYISSNDEASKENNLVKDDSVNDDSAPRSRKRKRPSISSQSSQPFISLKHHYDTTSTHVRGRAATISALPRSKSTSKTWDKISYEMWKLFKENKQSTEVLNRKIFLREAIYKVIKVHFPLDLYIVGSSLNGLGSNTSDIDLCLVLKNSEEMNQVAPAIPTLKYVKIILSKLPFVKNPIVILAKVPILKFTDSTSGLEVDLNVNNIVGIRNTQLIECYTRLDWRVQPLVLTFKKWARQNGINDAHNKTISSYTIVLMVIHYLQCGCDPPLLPCLHKLMPESFQPDSDITTLTLFQEIPEYKSKNKETIGQLFLGCLHYYSHRFQYNSEAISIRTGDTIPKYVAREHRAPKNTPSQWKYICVEEPFERTNTARSVYDEQAFLRILNVFCTSYHRLKLTQSLKSIMSLN